MMVCTCEKTATSVPPSPIEPVKADPRIELAVAARAELDRAEKSLAEMRKQSTAYS